MQPDKNNLSSTEFAALLVSEGRTTDVTMANALADGYPIDPDQLERAFYRRAIGFDVDIRIDPDSKKAIVTDLELGLKTTCTYLDGDENIDTNAQRLSKAVMKLKKKHDEAQEVEEDE